MTAHLIGSGGIARVGCCADIHGFEVLASALEQAWLQSRPPALVGTCMATSFVNPDHGPANRPHSYLNSCFATADRQAGEHSPRRWAHLRLDGM